MPSGNNVPLGNSTDDSGTGFAGLTPAPPASTGGDWASQAFAPSGSLTRQVPEQTWRPSQTALDQIVPPKPSSGFGGGLLTEENKSGRKSNPPLSNLAREHPENPVPLRGGLLGTPVNSNLVADDKHRIDGNKRVMHEDWARIINKAPEFGGILPTFKYHVETNGDAVRADVADMLWRASQTNPSQAQSLQRELAGALGGETIPLRRALLIGEEVLKQNASGNSLLGLQQPAKYDFEQMRKSYWQSMETYKAELAQKQQALQKEKEPVPKEEQRRSLTVGADQSATEPPAAHNQLGNTAGKPLINMKIERIANIKTDKPATFGVAENPVADGAPPFYRDHKRGADAVSTYGTIIDKEARAKTQLD
ncbi:MAG: hypothetical protein HQL45_02825 [Alphaproteobacteria bacterium]|nr:hypothetical protein [Alphaproteobacteria bacterium]